MPSEEPLWVGMRTTAIGDKQEICVGTFSNVGQSSVCLGLAMLEALRGGTSRRRHPANTFVSPVGD